MTSNLVYGKGTLLVAPGGGGAFTDLPAGADGQVLAASSTSPLGVAWGAGSASGNVVGPVSSITGDLAKFADTTGLLLADSGLNIDEIAIGPMSSTANHIAIFEGTDGVTLADSGVAFGTLVVGPSSVTTLTIPKFNGTTGKIIEGSNVVLSAGDVMEFPAGAGVTLTAGATASERKGSLTLSSGTHAQIATTAAITGCVIVATVVTLGTVTVPSTFKFAISNGVGFTITASDLTDTSVINWAIVA
jgi:hypothetical protein